MIQSIRRAFTILEIIARSGGEARLYDIAELAGVKQTTAHNILKTLGDLGYVRRHHGSTRYFLGSRISNLSRIAGNDHRLKTSLLPFLEAITHKTGETSFAAVPSGGEVFFLAGVECTKALRHSSPEGLRTPMPGSAAGMVLMAFIPDILDWMKPEYAQVVDSYIEEYIEKIRQQGFAVDIENVEKGLNCLAVPYFCSGQIEAVVGISGPSVRLPEDKLINYASQISHYLSQYPPA